ncbi:MAG: hypothetical protein WKF86_10905, partial [Acidimicrobiales bacterium]
PPGPALLTDLLLGPSEEDLDASIIDLCRLRWVAASRRVRRVQPELGALVDQVAAELAAAIQRCATADTGDGPAPWRCSAAALKTQVRAVHFAAHPEALRAMRTAVSSTAATIGARATVPHPFADMLNGALAAVESLSAAMAALLVTEPFHPDATPVDPIAVAPEQRPPTGPRVPTGPPSTGPGPRLCAA